MDANGLACQFIRFFVDWYKKISGCRHHVQTMSGDFFEYSYEKPELLYEYPGKLPDVYFNFSAFFPVGLPFREQETFVLLNMPGNYTEQEGAQSEYKGSNYYKIPVRLGDVTAHQLNRNTI